MADHTDADLVEQRQHTANLLATGHCDNPLHQLKQMLEAAGAHRLVAELRPGNFAVIEAWADARRDAAVKERNETIARYWSYIQKRDVQIARLREALEPFAMTDRAIGDEPGPFRFETATGYRLIERADLRRASAAVALGKMETQP